MYRYIKETIEDIKQYYKDNQLDYQQQLTWSNPRERVLLAWEAKVIAQYWKDLGIPALVVIAVACCIIILSIFIDMNVAWPALSFSAIIASVVFLLDWCVKTHFVYRITASGIEFHCWRIYPDFLFSGIKLLFVVLGVLVLVIGVIGQQGLLVLAGPVAIAIVVALPATNNGYKKAMLKARHRGADWSDINKIQYDSKKRLLRAYYEFDVSEEEKQKAMQVLIDAGYGASEPITDGEYDLFLTKENEQQALSLIQHALPNLTLEITKLRLPDNP